MSRIEDEQSNITQVKLIAVGDTGVGKTSILTRFTYEKFNDYSEPTLGAAFLTKKHTLPNNKAIEFHVRRSRFRSGIQLGRRSTGRSLLSTTGKPKLHSASTTSPHSAATRS